MNRERRAESSIKQGLFDTVLQFTPVSEVRTSIERAASLAFDLPIEPTVRLLDYGLKTSPFDVSIEPIVKRFGNGSRISCQDTLPFCIWVAARHLDDYQTAIVTAIRAGGDIDTNAAIVGGIVALSTGLDAIPKDWLRDREDLLI